MLMLERLLRETLLLADPVSRRSEEFLLLSELEVDVSMDLLVLVSLEEFMEPSVFVSSGEPLSVLLFHFGVELVRFVVILEVVGLLILLVTCLVC